MNIIFLGLIYLSFYAKRFELLFFLSFLLGVILDLTSGNLVGSSSLMFLGLLMLIYLYKKKFSSSNLIFQLIIVTTGMFIFSWLKNQHFSGQNLLILSFLTLIIYGFSSRIRKNTASLELDI